MSKSATTSIRNKQGQTPVDVKSMRSSQSSRSGSVLSLSGARPAPSSIESSQAPREGLQTTPLFSPARKPPGGPQPVSEGSRSPEAHRSLMQHPVGPQTGPMPPHARPHVGMPSHAAAPHTGPMPSCAGPQMGSMQSHAAKPNMGPVRLPAGPHTGPIPHMSVAPRPMLDRGHRSMVVPQGVGPMSGPGPRSGLPGASMPQGAVARPASGHRSMPQTTASFGHPGHGYQSHSPMPTPVHSRPQTAQPQLRSRPDQAPQQSLRAAPDLCRTAVPIFHGDSNQLYGSTFPHANAGQVIKSSSNLKSTGVPIFHAEDLYRMSEKCEENAHWPVRAEK